MTCSLTCRFSERMNDLMDKWIGKWMNDWKMNEWLSSTRNALSSFTQTIVIPHPLTRIAVKKTWSSFRTSRAVWPNLTFSFCPSIHYSVRLDPIRRFVHQIQPNLQSVGLLYWCTDKCVQEYESASDFSRVHATLHPALSIRPSVGLSVRRSVHPSHFTFLWYNINF